jgi:hypothetical protein
MFSKLLVGIIISGLATLSFAEDLVDPVRIDAKTPDRCFYSSDKYQFNGVHVTPSGETSYVLNSFVEFYSQDGKETPPDLYKGRLALSDEEGDIYEICVRGGEDALIYKLEKIDSQRPEE